MAAYGPFFANHAIAQCTVSISRTSFGARGGIGSSLKVITTRMFPGYLRKNGVPYSANTVLTEYFTRFAEPNGDTWLVGMTIVDDPQYLTQPSITSTYFKEDS